MNERSDMAGVPAVMLNPSTEEDMARRKTTKKRSTKKRSTTRRRRSPARKTTRRRRRRRNPSPEIKGTGMAALAGAAVGGAGYALEGTDLSNYMQAGILAGGGLVLGMIASMYSKPTGAAVAAAGLALGTKLGLDHYMATKASTEGMGAVDARLGATNWQMAGMHGVDWQMAGMGAVEVPLG